MGEGDLVGWAGWVWRIGTTLADLDTVDLRCGKEGKGERQGHHNAHSAKKEEERESTRHTRHSTTHSTQREGKSDDAHPSWAKSASLSRRKFERASNGSEGPNRQLGLRHLISRSPRPVAPSSSSPLAAPPWRETLRYADRTPPPPPSLSAAAAVELGRRTPKHLSPPLHTHVALCSPLSLSLHRTFAGTCQFRKQALVFGLVFPPSPSPRTQFRRTPTHTPRRAVHPWAFVPPAGVPCAFPPLPLPT